MNGPNSHADKRDSIVFEHAGLQCSIVCIRESYWCGYVRRPEDVEPVRWQSEIDESTDEIVDAEVDVWGGVTYGPDDDGWVGFDDAHAEKLHQHRESDTPKAAVRNETERLAEQIAALDD